MTTSAIVQDLRASRAGQVIAPGDAAYDDAREVFNAMHSRRPAAIARCSTTADVVAALEVARRSGLIIAVKSGGHSVAGLSVCDNGILIDLSGLKKIEVDVAAKTARAGGGVLWGEFDAATQQHGLHTPGGRVTTTGVGGFTTGGGYGWTSSKFGLTCDNLLSAEVVLADGRVVIASETQNADLFWGIRGGGGNFGIVTRFDFRLHPLGPIVPGGHVDLARRSWTRSSQGLARLCRSGAGRVVHRVCRGHGATGALCSRTCQGAHGLRHDRDVRRRSCGRRGGRQAAQRS